MSVKIVHECDRCGYTLNTSTMTVPARWGKLTQTGGASSGNEKAPAVDWLLCPECVDDCCTTVVRKSVAA